MARLNPQEIKDVVVEVWRIAMEEEMRQQVAAVAEMRGLIARIETLAAQGELDISHLAEDAERRAYALAVEKAEQAVIYAESDLDYIRRQRSKKVQLKAEYGGYQDAISSLAKQEKVASEYLDATRQRLLNLKLESRGMKLLVTDSATTADPTS